MPEVGNWTPGKRRLRKPLIQKQKRCYIHPQASERSMPSVSEGTDQRKRKIKTLGRITPLISSLLTYPVGSRHPPPIWKKTRTTKEVFGTLVNEDKDEAKTPLWQIWTLLLKKKKKISPMSNTFTTEGRVISPTSVFKRRTRSQKTRWWTNIDGDPVSF